MKRLLTVFACSIVLSLVVAADGVLAAQPEKPNASAANNALAFDLLKNILAKDKMNEIRYYTRTRVDH
jgi:hypothetical protein